MIIILSQSLLHSSDTIAVSLFLVESCSFEKSVSYTISAFHMQAWHFFIFCVKSCFNVTIVGFVIEFRNVISSTV